MTPEGNKWESIPQWESSYQECRQRADMIESESDLDFYKDVVVQCIVTDIEIN
jgi:hypothetical protein